MATLEEQRQQLVRVASYLRENPSALSTSAEEIAAKCQVDVDLVRSALSAGARAATPAAPGFRSYLREVNRRLDAFLERLEPWMPGVIAGSSVLSFLLSYGLGLLVPAFVGGGDIGLVLAFVTVAFHMLLYFHYGKSRHPVWGALSVWGFLSIVVSINQLASDSAPELSRPLLTLVITFSMLFVSLLYGAAGLGAALLGGYRRLRVGWKEERQLSRAELLERLFEIEDALESGDLEVYEPRSEWLQKIRLVILPTSPLLGFSMGLLFVISTLFVPMPDPGQFRLNFVIVYVGLGGLNLFMQSATAYLGGGIGKSVVCSLFFFAGGTIAQVLVVLLGRMYHLELVMRSQITSVMSTTNLVFGFLLAILVGLFAGFGAVIEEATVTEKRRRLNDPEILLADLITTQRRLNTDASIKCVVVFDAAKSSLMKANSDALTAEWSFRAYQEFLKDIVEEHEGEIHSTAGDGAVCVFPEVGKAFVAARSVQTKIDHFNQETNRLPDPFRLRVGLHCDTVAGDLGEVQFAAVIDIAAHTEAASQVGGIAVTEPVKAYLERERFAELPELIDGYRAFIALEPRFEQ